MLENRLDKAMIKYNEAQSIRKTYEQIVKRLKVDEIKLLKITCFGRGSDVLHVLNVLVSLLSFFP